MVITTATKITLIRLINIPFFVILLSLYTKSKINHNTTELFRYCAVALFIITGTLDIVDGYIARRKNEVTHFGSILDPLADKILLSTCFIILLYIHKYAIFKSNIPWWFLNTVLIRDIGIVFGTFILHRYYRFHKIRVRISGKITTFLQIVIILFILMQIEQVTVNYLLCISTVFTGISGILYMYDGIKTIKFNKIQPI